MNIPKKNRRRLASAPNRLRSKKAQGARIDRLQEMEKLASRQQRAAKKAAAQIGSGKHCSRHQRCRNLACPICRYLKQQKIVADFMELMPGPEEQHLRLKAVTIAPAFGRVPIGELSEVDIRKFGLKVARMIRKEAPDAFGQLVVDVSYNSSEDTGSEDYWQLHVHCIFFGLTKKARNRLRKALKRNAKKGGRPLHTKTAYDPAGWVAYMAKPEFKKRTSYVDHNNVKNTRDAALTRKQEIELGEWLSAYKVGQRMFEVGRGCYNI